MEIKINRTILFKSILFISVMLLFTNKVMSKEVAKVKNQYQFTRMLIDVEIPDSLDERIFQRYNRLYKQLAPNKLSGVLNNLERKYEQSKKTHKGEISLNHKETDVLTFLNLCCGMPLPKDWKYNNTDYWLMHDDYRFIKSIDCNYIPVVTGWYKENGKYIGKALTRIYCYLISCTIELQKEVYDMFPHRQQGYLKDWDNSIWGENIWCSFKRSYKIEKKLEEYRQSLIPMFQWYVMNGQLLSFPPDNVVLSGVTVSEKEHLPFIPYMPVTNYFLFGY